MCIFEIEVLFICLTNLCETVFGAVILYIQFVDLSVVSTFQLCDCHRQTYWMSSMVFSFSHLTKILIFACSVLLTS